MKTLHTRLDYQKEAVLAYTKRLGRFRAMLEFGVKDYLCFSNWLEEATADENFGLSPAINLDRGQTLGDHVVNAFLRKVAELQAENRTLKERVEYLESRLDGHKEKEELQAMAVLEVCQD